MWRFALLALLIIAAVILGYAYRGRRERPHNTKPEASDKSLQTTATDARHDPIAIPGVIEPAEMLVAPFPKAVLSGPDQLLANAMKETGGNADRNALLPALNRILAKYPNYADGYVMRLDSLCNRKDRAAILSDIDSALRYEAPSANTAETRASVLSMKAKMEHDGGDDASALQDLDAALHADITDGARFVNSGARPPRCTVRALAGCPIIFALRAFLAALAPWRAILVDQSGSG